MRILVLAVAGALSGGAVAAQQPDSAAFIIRLGTDTTAIERYVRTENRLIAEAVQRSPNTVVHRLTMDFAREGRVSRAEWEVRGPGAERAALRRVITFQGDSAIVETTQGASTRTQRVAAAAAIPVAGPFYSPYELAIMRAIAAGADSVQVPLLAGAGVVRIPVRRIGRDSVALTNQFEEAMRAHIDPRGRLLHLSTPAFASVERLPWLDLDALTREFAERDASGRGMGPLSPRRTARERVAEANLWLDYSRPSMRGRPVWGGLVPWGQVWRMGANDAAHLATDRPLQIDGLTLQPGTYTLFLLPNASGDWDLIVNRATGISGLDYDPAQDVGRVDLRVDSIERAVEQFTLEVEESGDGGVIALLWDRTRAWVPFRVR